MKPQKITYVFILLLLSQLISAQQTKNQWEKWNYLIGEWVGEDNGQPGQGKGKFSFETDLDGNILVRKSHTEFPASANRAETKHDDLMIIYRYGDGDSHEAIYFDNEDHTIKYKVSYTDKSIILTSDIVPSSVRFRYTYTYIDDKTVDASFEMATPQEPEVFKMYLKGRSVKVK